MSTDFPKGSMGEADAKGQKVAAIIIILAFIALHVIAFVIPDHPHFGGWRIALTAAATIWTIIVAISLFEGADLTEDNKWPYVVLIALAFASAVCIFYTPVGLSL